MFRRLDQDGDNFITIEEMKTLVKELLISKRENLHPEQVEQHAQVAFNQMSENPCLGKVSFDELYTYVVARPTLFYDLAGWQAVFSKYSDLQTHTMRLHGAALLVRDLCSVLGKPLEPGEADSQAAACIEKMDNDGDG